MEIGNNFGIFIGLESASYEYKATIIAPYRSDSVLRVGEFLLIENVDGSYIVARTTNFVPKGELTSFYGKEWLAKMSENPEKIGFDIKRKKVMYEITIKLLGSIKEGKFTPHIEKLPHITSKVLKPNEDVVREICNYALKEQENGVRIGTFWLNRNIEIRFNPKHMISKRTFIFAKAGYGKSNLMKILASNWKKDFGSLIIFDPEGEYAVTTKDGYPGIMDVIPALLITNRKSIHRELHGVNVYDKLKFNLGNLPPKFIIPILVQEQKHETIFFSKLMNLDGERWSQLVDYLYEHGWGAERKTIAALVLDKDENEISPEEKKDMQPILNNLVSPISKLHDPDSKLMEILDNAARENTVIIIDISLLDSHTALRLSSIVVGYFFNRNQQLFIGGDEDLYKIVFVMEEAQSVIGKNSNITKFVELAKEGRKYKLGGVFITQQPGSISEDILSQGDNFFVFHLLSKGDLKALQNVNAHYSDDILTQLLNEPIAGKAYMWTHKQPFVLPIKIDLFESIAKPHNYRDVQEKNNILGKILSKIDVLEAEYSNTERSIIKSLQEILENDSRIPGNTVEEKLDYLLKLISDKDKGLYEYTNSITVDLYKSLSDSSKEALKVKGYLQTNSDGEPFSLKINYLIFLLRSLENSLKNT